ncbi:MAG: DNA replication and repair protein RecF [Fusobacterium mortiferum]|uniref:DNA replication and repair protein RecF n=2 Tax=Fusobacterium mortiferum TaxID=850 RepID=A0A414PR18_FUSMR|nr:MULTISPECIES: DNA replication and repair protein RecF [Fusobacterium]AVQ18114.1 DNA replication and repair protein RecF [Fusobacterium mortiferum ATCC 9817]EEO36645.1 DNA replication and repair protein RecF [Fusobacterium mortiferum ATCC 9817]MCF2627806.1 DNA replication/repair protein RecF [Fusobacterium mortiferum]MCF2699495.1 DNA replication/repair protein RecF [Fusobacterium mortiferum]MCI6381921.1 DNA replication and repair protein RecF [Fusobacterium mortiferum]
MEILEINYINFRNLIDGSVKFFPKLNLFFGKNGQGKTSLLEAVYFNATGKSFRTSKANEMMKYGVKRTGVYIVYRDNIGEKTLTVKFNDNKKEYYYNNKKVPYDEFYGKLNVVTYIPEDIVLITGSPSIRRTFFDGEIAQTNSEYFQDLKNYNKLLKIRNKYLKEERTKDTEYLVYEDEFIKYGAKVIEKRLEYVQKISIILNLNYRKLFDNKKELSLSYECHLGNIKKLSLKEIEKLLREKIKKNFSQEKRYGFSLCGPQKDDFLFILNGHEAKSTASQGEKKSIIFSLKLSEIDMVIREKKENPVLIIDDISSYFDSNRKESILNYLEKRNIQVLVSSTGDLGIDSNDFYVEGGEIVYDTKAE